jgi:hypothetical protein
MAGIEHSFQVMIYGVDLATLRPVRLPEEYREDRT